MKLLPSLLPHKSARPEARALCIDGLCKNGGRLRCQPSLGEHLGFDLVPSSIGVSLR
jgi:hypothetical protein